MKEFSIGDYRHLLELEDTLKFFLDKNFMSNSLEDINQALRELNVFIAMETGLKPIPVSAKYMEERDILDVMGTYKPKKLVSSAKEEIKITFDAIYGDGVTMLLTFLRMKYLQYQRESILNGNSRIDDKTLESWKYCYDVIEDEKIFNEYLANPVITAAYEYERRQLEDILYQYKEIYASGKCARKQLKENTSRLLKITNFNKTADQVELRKEIEEFGKKIYLKKNPKK